VPEANTHAARIAAELARRYPASFKRFSSRLRAGTRRRLLLALNMDADAGGASGARRGLSAGEVHAWREGAAAAGTGSRRGEQHNQQRRDDESESGSEYTDDSYDSSEKEEEEEEEEEDDGLHDDAARSQAEFEALAAVARKWEAAELARAKEEDAKDLATMMRLCCIAMKPSGERASAAAPPPKTKLAGRAPAAAPAAAAAAQPQREGEGRDRRRRAPRS
jgi:hypothetical protein